MSSETLREAVKEALANGQQPKPEQAPTKEEYLSSSDRKTWKKTYARVEAVQRSHQQAIVAAEEPLRHLLAVFGPQYGLTGQDKIDKDGRIIRSHQP